MTFSSIDPFDLHGFASESAKQYRKHIQELVYYGESRLKRAVDEILKKPMEDQAPFQKCLRKELHYFLTYVGLITSMGQVVDVPFTLRSLAFSLGRIAPEDLPMQFNVEFVQALNITRDEDRGEVVASYKRPWWEEFRPSWRSVIDDGSIGECLSHHRKLIGIENKHRFIESLGSDITPSSFAMTPGERMLFEPLQNARRTIMVMTEAQTSHQSVIFRKAEEYWNLHDASKAEGMNRDHWKMGITEMGNNITEIGGVDYVDRISTPAFQRATSCNDPPLVRDSKHRSKDWKPSELDDDYSLSPLPSPALLYRSESIQTDQGTVPVETVPPHSGPDISCGSPEEMGDLSMQASLSPGFASARSRDEMAELYEDIKPHIQEPIQSYSPEFHPPIRIPLADELGDLFRDIPSTPGRSFDMEILGIQSPNVLATLYEEITPQFGIDRQSSPEIKTLRLNPSADDLGELFNDILPPSGLSIDPDITATRPSDVRSTRDEDVTLQINVDRQSSPEICALRLNPSPDDLGDLFRDILPPAGLYPNLDINGTRPSNVPATLYKEITPQVDVIRQSSPEIYAPHLNPSPDELGNLFRGILPPSGPFSNVEYTGTQSPQECTTMREDSTPKCYPSRHIASTDELSELFMDILPNPEPLKRSEAQTPNKRSGFPEDTPPTYHPNCYISSPDELGELFRDLKPASELSESPSAYVAQSPNDIAALWQNTNQPNNHSPRHNASPNELGALFQGITRLAQTTDNSANTALQGTSNVMSRPPASSNIHEDQSLSLGSSNHLNGLPSKRQRRQK
uniref:Uncharacterized protein n=1 Tax=Psilocybe cubensis TaxID=181762 RepID=A0A8H7Y6U1_PSICU